MEEIEVIFSKLYLRKETIDRLFAQRRKLIDEEERKTIERINLVQSLEEIAEIEMELKQKKYGIPWNVYLTLHDKEVALRFREKIGTIRR